MRAQWRRLTRANRKLITCKLPLADLSSREKFNKALLKTPGALRRVAESAARQSGAGRSKKGEKREE